MAKQPESKPESKEPEAKTGTTATPVELDAAVSLGRIADALERIADKVAPVATLHAVAGLRAVKRCAEGHAMQPTDDYCQACEREKRNPKTAPDNDAA